MHKILLVDDSELIHKLIRMQLVDEAVELRSAYDGPSAIKLAESLRPDLILLDVDMPDMDGLEVFRQLRQNPTTRQTQILFLTADSKAVETAQSWDLGTIDHIKKPFEAAAITTRIRKALGPSPTARIAS